jgi:hypothetical protein
MRRHCNLAGMMFAADIDRVSRHTEDSSKSVGVSRQSSLLLDNRRTVRGVLWRGPDGQTPLTAARPPQITAGPALRPTYR